MQLTANEIFLRLRDGLVRLDTDTAAFAKDQDIDPLPGSPGAKERARSPDLESLDTVCSLGTMLLETISEHAGLLVRAMTEPITTIACWTCVRSMLESSAIASWLLDPGIDAKQRIGRAYAHRYEGLEQQIKFVRSTNSPAAELKKIQDRLEEVVRDATAQGYAPVLDAKGKKRLGIGQTMPKATDIIKTVLDEGMAYRMMSAVAHHHSWALLQLGFRQAAVQIPGDQFSGRLVEKSAGSVHAYSFLAIRAAKSLTFPLWRKCLYYGWDRDRLTAVLEGVYDEMGAKDGVRFWR